MDTTGDLACGEQSWNWLTENVNDLALRIDAESPHAEMHGGPLRNRVERSFLQSDHGLCDWLVELWIFSVLVVLNVLIDSVHQSVRRNSCLFRQIHNCVSFSEPATLESFFYFLRGSAHR